MERHYHKAKYDDNNQLLDECDLCGEDLRSEVHFRANEIS